MDGIMEVYDGVCRWFTPWYVVDGADEIDDRAVEEVEADDLVEPVETDDLLVDPAE
jgi:hypothetical protein